MALEELNDSTTLSRFTGSNPARWLFEVERFFSLYAIYEEERFPYVIEYFDNEPFYWFNSWYRGPEHLTWNAFTVAMLTTFPTVPQPPTKTAPTTTPKHPSYVIPSTPKTSHTVVPKQASKPAQNASNRHHYPARNSARAPTETHTRNSLQNTRFLPFIMMKPTTIGRREWRPPWQPPSRSVESAPKAIVASPTPHPSVFALEWKQPWSPKPVTPPWSYPCRYGETFPNDLVRLEWRPPWEKYPVLEDKDVLRCAGMIRASPTHAYLVALVIAFHVFCMHVVSGTSRSSFLILCKWVSSWHPRVFLYVFL